MSEHVHICTESTLCRCYALADEPSQKCPVHGYPWPPRCDCGRFVKRPLIIHEPAGPEVGS